MDTTYRLCVIGDYSACRTTGLTAATPELAKLVPGPHIIHARSTHRLGVERCDWADDYARSRNAPSTSRHVDRLTLVEAETVPGEWHIGV